MFYPLEPLPPALRAAAYANPITSQVDVLRYATTGLGDPSLLPAEIVGFTLFTAASFIGALKALGQDSSVTDRQERTRVERCVSIGV